VSPNFVIRREREKNLVLQAKPQFLHARFNGDTLAAMNDARVVHCPSSKDLTGTDKATTDEKENKTPTPHFTRHSSRFRLRELAGVKCQK